MKVHRNSCDIQRQFQCPHSRRLMVSNEFNDGSGFIGNLSVVPVIKQVVAELEGSAARATGHLENVTTTVGAAAAADTLPVSQAAVP